MVEAAAYAVADLVDDAHRASGYVIPGAFDERVAPSVAAAVADAACRTGVTRA
jgi:malate dehydrogenase (oxaloacetate-decarboxylating)